MSYIFPNDGSESASGISLDDSSLVVVPTTQLQAFAEGVDHSLFKARGTGVNTTYVFVAAAGGTTFDMPAVFGEIKSDQGYFDVHYTGATGVTIADLTVPSTYVYIDNANTLQQQTSIPTRQDWSRKIFVARIGVNISTNQVIGFEYNNNPLGNFTNTSRDLYQFLLAQGVPFKKDQIITGRAADLGFDVSAGSLLEFGGTGDIDNPNIKSFDAVANTSYNLMSRTALVSSETNLVKFWDDAGTITPLGSTTFVGHRLYRFSSGNFAIQYGQANYANISLAKAGIGSEDYVLNPVLKDATFFGWWLIEDTATNTSGTTSTAFVEYALGIQGGVSNGLSGALLRGNNLSDLLDVPAAKATLGINIQTLTAKTASFTPTPAEVDTTIRMQIVGATTITIADSTVVGLAAGSGMVVNWESDSGTNTIVFGASGSQTIISTALGMSEVGTTAVLTYLGSNSWFLVGTLI